MLVAGCGDDLVILAFHKRTIDPAFRAEGVAVFDVDRDGDLDVVTRELWYAAPTFAPHELRTPHAYDPASEYAESFHAFHLDVDRDGYEDLVTFDYPPGWRIVWCRNPAGADVHWECHEALASTNSESPFVTDLEGAGPVLVAEVEPQHALAILAPGADPTTPWTVRPIGAPDQGLGHGLGPVDVDGDGRLDVVTGTGWLAAPAWTWHPTALCENDCAQIAGFDYSGDGRMDLVGTSPHHYGVWWFEQAEGGAFTRHVIDDSVSQTHALRLADFDGDGLPEVVTGKRQYSHFSGDPGIDDPVVLVVYHPHREAGELVWDRLELDADSGVGNQFEIADVDADGDPDIVIASRRGVFVFTKR